MKIQKPRAIVNGNIMIIYEIQNKHMGYLFILF